MLCVKHLACWDSGAQLFDAATSPSPTVSLLSPPPCSDLQDGLGKKGKKPQGSLHVANHEPSPFRLLPPPFFCSLSRPISSGTKN